MLLAIASIAQDNATLTFFVLLLQAAVQGIVVIYDIGGVTASHTLMMTPAIMKKHVVVFQVGKDMYYSLIMRS